MQDTEWEDVVVGNNIADTDWEDVKPVTQSVLDDRDGKIYNVPLAMDGIDTEFAIDTQHKGADKSSFFGKVFMDTAKIASSLSTGSIGMQSTFNEADFKNSRSAFRGAVGVAGNIADTLIVEATNLRDKQYEAEHGYSRYPSFFLGNNETKEEVKAKAQETVAKLENIRKKNQDWWKQAQESIVKENEMTETNRFFEGLGGGFASIGTSLGAGLASGNPVIASSLIGFLFGNMRKNELMDKALEQGVDFDDAEQISAIGGTIEGGLEVVGGAMLSKIAKLKPIIDAKNRVLSSAIVKAAQDKIGKQAVKKIATQHADSVIGAFAKGFGSEFLEEAAQTGLGMGYENLVGLSNYSMDEIYGETLLSGIIGGITGGVAGGVGTAYNNKLIVQTNERIKKLLKSEAPSLDGQELQVMADSIQEMLFQEATNYADEFNKVLDKQVAPDTMKEGLTPDSLMAETRKLLQEKYKMNDEQINKTINSWLAVVDARNQFNEAYTTYFQKISEVRDNDTLADMEARLAAVRAVAVAKAEGISVADAVKRMNLKFVKTDWSNEVIARSALEQAMYKSEMTNFEDFYDEALAKKGQKQRYITQNIDGLDIDVPSDVAIHDKKDHNLSKEEWLGVFEGLKNPLEARVSFKGTNYGNISALLKIKANDRLYGIAITVNHGRKFITTAFKTTDVGYKDWVNKKIANKPAPENPARSSSMKHGDVIIGQSLPEIISNLDRDVNSLLQQQALFQESLDIANQNAELDANNPAYEGETININGVDRTVYNSNGDRIAMSDPALRNFYNWFGDSKVVDEQGRPLVVYHGTSAGQNVVKSFFDIKVGQEFIGLGKVEEKTNNSIIIGGKEYNALNIDVMANHGQLVEKITDTPFTVFSKKMQGKSTGARLSKLGFFFSESEEYTRPYGKIVIPVYLDIKNPFIIDAEGKNVKSDDFYKEIKNKAKNNDGVIIYNILGSNTGKEFVAFEPNQIKSTSNRGTYSESDNIYLQEGTNAPRGAYLNNIIYLFENADPSTVIHELGHFFLDDMQKFADNETTKRQLEAIYKFVGSTDGKLTPEQHEYFANAFELYLMEGRAPNKVLEGVFVRFKNWLRRMLAEIQRISYVKLTPEIRKVFDEMLGGRGIDFAMQMSGAKMAEALESGTIPANVIAKAVQLLEDGKMSRADMDDLIARMKSGELKRSEFNQELKKFENSNTKHNERLNPFDKVKYKDMLSKGNFSKRDVLEKIERLLKWSEPRSQNGKLVGRFSNLKMNQKFDHIRELMNMDKALAKEKLDENVKLINAIIRGEETGDMDSLVFDNKILTIKLNKASASMLIDVYNAISDSYNLGRLTTAVTGEARKARKNRMIQETKDVITGDGRVNWRKEQSKAKQFVNQLGLSQMSWQGILDILSMNDKSSKTGQSKLSKELDVFDAQQKEAQGVADDGEKASKLMEKRLKGVGNSAISVSRYVNTKLEEKFTIEWNGSKKTFTKDQLLDIYMKSKDPETKKMMAEDKVLRYDDSFLFEVNQVLTAEDRAIADALFEFYDENYEKVNAFYEEKYGVSLGKRAFYSPRSMERGGINVDTGDLSSYVGFSATKERKAKAGAVKIKGAFQVLQDYIINSNHWIAWSDKLIDINAVMGDVEIKNMIRNLFGENMEKRIAYEVSRMASNDKFQSKFGYGKLFNKIRSNYAIAALAAKPSLMIKQLTSFPAYWEHMSTAEFMSGLADFAVHMKEAVETLGNTTLMKTRDVNIIKDFEELSKSELFKKNANKVKLRELLMANIKLGDRGAIYMGGWALYKAELKKNLAKGMSEADAKAKALEMFERVTDETQQSGRLSQQSYWQSNPFLRAFTMFQSSQNQYLRKEINAIRGLLTGRADGKQAAKALFIFHVLLPCFFQYASDGFDWDEKAQLRAALLGSLNGIFVLNGIMERGLDVALGTADAWRATQVGLRDVIPFWGSGEDMAKFFINLAEGDIDLEDYIEVMRAFGKPLGELTGVPVKYPLDVIQNFGNYAEAGEYKKEALLWLGWSPYALRDKEED